MIVLIIIFTFYFIVLFISILYMFRYVYISLSLCVCITPEALLISIWSVFNLLFMVSFVVVVDMVINTNVDNF